MFKNITKNVKNQIVKVHENEDGMELIQVILIILIAVTLGVALMTFATDLFTSTKKKATDAFVI